jgi:hypothetical protein
MIDNILSHFKKDFQLGHSSALLNHIANIINIINKDFMKEADSRNAAIDALCELLQSYKDQPSASI